MIDTKLSFDDGTRQSEWVYRDGKFLGLIWTAGQGWLFRVYHWHPFYTTCADIRKFATRDDALAALAS